MSRPRLNLFQVTRGVRRAQDFLGVVAATVVLEAAREAVRIVLPRAGLGADLSQSFLALAFTVYACGLFVHGEFLVNRKPDEFAVVTSAVAT